MELRCQLRFTDDPAGGARAILDADTADRSVRITIEATGATKGEAFETLAERTRELYGATCSLVDTVEELARTYFAGADQG